MSLAGNQERLLQCGEIIHVAGFTITFWQKSSSLLVEVELNSIRSLLLMIGIGALDDGMPGLEPRIGEQSEILCARTVVKMGRIPEREWTDLPAQEFRFFLR